MTVCPILDMDGKNNCVGRQTCGLKEYSGHRDFRAVPTLMRTAPRLGHMSAALLPGEDGGNLFIVSSCVALL
jgi:hypothetical protein